MRPSLSKVPPHGMGALANRGRAPPATEARRSLPPAKNAIVAAIGREKRILCANAVCHRSRDEIVERAQVQL